MGSQRIKDSGGKRIPKKLGQGLSRTVHERKTSGRVMETARQHLQAKKRVIVRGMNIGDELLKLVLKTVGE